MIWQVNKRQVSSASRSVYESTETRVNVFLRISQCSACTLEALGFPNHPIQEIVLQKLIKNLTKARTSTLKDHFQTDIVKNVTMLVTCFTAACLPSFDASSVHFLSSLFTSHPFHCFRSAAKISLGSQKLNSNLYIPFLQLCFPSMWNSHHRAKKYTGVCIFISFISLFVK